MTTYTWLTGTGFWSTSTKWSPSGTPTASDAAVISATGSGYSVNINSAAFAMSLAESSANATVNDVSSLTIGAGGFALSGGTFALSNNSALTVNGTYTISNAGKFILNAGTTLSATTTKVSGGTFNWAGGTISGGTIDVAALNLTASSAYGHIANNAQVKNAAGTGPGTIYDTGYDSTLYFDNTQTFANGIINLGSAGGYYSFLTADDTTGAGTVLTLASTTTVNATSGAYIEDSGGAGDGIVNQGTINQTSGYLIFAGNSFTNAGTINASGADDTLTIQTTTFSNTGAINLSGAGNAFNITPGGANWSNTGSIKVSSGAELFLSGAFTVASLGSVTDSGGAIFVQGTLNNAGGVLNGSGGLGPITLDGGTVEGGTATSAGLLFSSGDSTLDDVIFKGAFDLSAGESVHFTNGTQVTTAAGTGPGTINDTGYDSTLNFDNTQTLADTTIDLGSAGGYYSFLTDSDLIGGGTVLTLASTTTINATGGAYINDSSGAGDGIVNKGTINQTSGYLVFAGNSFTNAGTINASGADDTLTIQTTTFSNTGAINLSGAGNAFNITPGGANWSNTGSIKVSSGAELFLSGAFTVASLGSVTDSGGAIFVQGTLNNTGGVLNGSGGLGAITLDGGTVEGGTATSAGLLFSSSDSTLDDVIFKGALDLSGGESIHFTNGTQVTTAAGTGPGTINDTGYASTLNFDNTQTLADTTIDLGSAGGYYSFLTDSDLIGGGTVLTLASTTTINATGGAYINDSSGAGDGIVNQGTINQTSGYFVFAGNSFTNAGTINASGADDTLTIQTTTFSNTGAINISGAGDAFTITPGGANWSNTGAIAVSGGAELLLSGAFTVASLGAVTDSGGAILIQGALNNAGGVLNGSGGLGPITLDGGTVEGGTATSAGLLFSASGGTLDDVIFKDTLDLSAGESVHFTNGTRVTTAAGMGPGTINDTGYASTLNFDNTQTLANTTIALGTGTEIIHF